MTIANLVALGAFCVGDCNADLRVTVDELVTGVNMNLGDATVDACPAMLCRDGLELPPIDCAITAVGNALSGCPEPQ